MSDDRNKLPSRTVTPSANAPPAASQLRMFVANVKSRLLAEDIEGAANAYVAGCKSHPEWRLEEPDLLTLIRALHDKKLWSASIRPMTDYLRQYPVNSVRMRFRLAEILISVQRRPITAIEVLDKLDVPSLPPNLQETRLKLLARAEAIKSDCELEMVDGDE